MSRRSSARLMFADCSGSISPRDNSLDIPTVEIWPRVEARLDQRHPSCRDAAEVTTADRPAIRSSVDACAYAAPV